MRVLITGGAGMLGAKLARRLATDGELAGRSIDQIKLFDVVDAAPISDAPVTVVSEAGDLRCRETVAGLAADQPDLIFHLASVVSGEAEQNFDKGYEINLDGTRMLLEEIRKSAKRPRFVFASSIAVFGAPFPQAIPDDYYCTPLTSYGTQKAICELLVSDYSRKGFLDGVAIRLPTICVRPGKPNAAASGFFSNIIREPLAGKEAVLPVSEDVRHWFASPRAAIEYMLHAATIDLQRVGAARAINMPGLSITVAEQIAALREVAGERVVARIRREPDEFIQGVVAGWPQRFDAQRAMQLGFQPDTSFEEIIRYHIEDELDGSIA
jgi:nucleoside-diphosphate-sugar epimerase